MPNQSTPILTYIDYYTRFARAELLESKSEEEIVIALEKIALELGFPNQIISDNGKEFVNNEVKKLVALNNTDHHKCSTEKTSQMVESKDFTEPFGKELEN
jgi:hypothetical protein